MGNILSQSFRLPPPTLTEKNLPDQSGRVHIVTGGYAGCGLELSKILYQKNATVYLAGRSADKANAAISAIKQAFPDSKGKVDFIKVDFSDLSTIKSGVEGFLSKEKRLDVLTNNAGVMTPPAKSKDAHDRDLTLGTNIIGPYLFTKLLTPILQSTAKDAPKNSVRVTWASSAAAFINPPAGGVAFDKDGNVSNFSNDNGKAYAQSKASNMLLASEFAKRYGRDGIISVSWNPGNLTSELQRHMNSVAAWVLDRVLLFPTIFGAYTELYAACSEDITESQNGAFIAPWGRVYDAPGHITSGTKTEAEGGSGHAEKLWTWLDKTTSQYA
ncbi:NAD(P)-binding protein [Microthyrium microscopicum]|uniref:NAD(P)-binding protein n=1 Tax=Microthyrium microscopicum TaxID=703497 RepID=A0A6A6UR15_9PEZI|nr:NAD(P)-binding protein [Microthyrium microscopicum]